MTARRGLLTLALIAPTSCVASADEFDRLDGAILAGLPGDPGVRAVAGLSTAEIGNLRGPLRDSKMPVLVVRTGEGNLSRLMISPGLRKPADAGRPPAPVIVLERFDTFEAGPFTRRLARGRGVLLFGGSRVDLDSGQVVPEGYGGDLRFDLAGEGGPRLVAEGGSTLHAVESPTIPPPAPGSPSPGRAVAPPDFDGRYRLVANGQWSGVLDLSGGAGGSLSGRFRSDQTGGAYKVTGSVAPESPNLARFSIDLPRARLEFEGRLWTEGKAGMAGTASLLGRDFGFVALRDGGRLSPEFEDIAGWLAPPAPPARATRRVVVRDSGRYECDGAALDLAGLVAALAGGAGADGPARVVVVAAPPSMPIAAASAIVRALRSAGVDEVRWEVADGT